MKKSMKIMTAIVLAIMMALCGLLVWRYTHADKLERAVAAQLGQLEGKSNDEIEASLNRVVEEGYMAISINANPTFANGQAMGTLHIENNPNNKYSQEVTITRDDTGETIYRSGLIDPNYHIQEDVLLEDLEAGDYDCKASFVAYDEDHQAVGSAAAKIVVSILN